MRVCWGMDDAIGHREALRRNEVDGLENPCLSTTALAIEPDEPVITI